MCSTPLTCCSIGAATESATTLAFAPGYEQATCTVGGVMSGYWATGSMNAATPPNSVIDDRNDPGEDRMIDEETCEHGESGYFFVGDCCGGVAGFSDGVIRFASTSTPG